ncbi:MAG TPA: Spy/CpxP family protein refolding chaperone [Beijerinckiaceae bacterium]|nr:Spy/CpxP family protein refolding chaperone [Beijerinckiaceae bacterium]
MSGMTDFIRRRPIISTLVGVAVVIGGVGAVSAQYYGGPGSWGRGGSGGWGRGGIERFCTVPHARFQPVMRAYIKADLNMTGAQAAEFDKLADVLAPAFEEIKADLCGSFRADSPKITPPEKLEKIAAALRKAATAAENAVAPARSLYGQLDDAQKAEIDRRMERRRMAREGRGGYGEGRGGYGEGRGMGRDRDEHRGWHEHGMGPRRDGQGGWERGPGQPGFGQSPEGPGGPFFRGGQQ